MNRLLTVPVILSALILAPILTGSEPRSEVAVEDPSLKAELRNQLALLGIDPQLTIENLRLVTSLRARGKGARSLAGIEACESLARLDLADNQIADLTPLAGLVRLESLNLAGNQVSDVSPLSKLSRLRYLDLSRNQIEDIAPLALAGNLGSLDLSSNGVADIEPLRGLRQLWSLDLSTNSIRNLEALEGLESLTFLNLDSNRVQDLAPLSNLTALRSLSLNENVISDISPLIDLARRRSRTGSGAVFWSVQLRGNELDAEDRALAELEKYSVYVGRPETGRSSSPEKDASDSGRSAETAVSAMRGEHRGSLSARQTFLTNHKRRL